MLRYLEVILGLLRAQMVDVPSWMRSKYETRTYYAAAAAKLIILSAYFYLSVFIASASAFFT